MSTWTSLPTTSCVHKYASGCLLPTQSICCFCADYCNSSVPVYLPILDERNRIAYNSTRYAKYCWRCQATSTGNPSAPLKLVSTHLPSTGSEYWGARQNSQILPAPLATLNFSATFPESYNRNLHLDPRSQGVTLTSSGIPSGPVGFQRPLYHRCNNITALREELQAINTGIARALSSLQDLGSQLSYRSLQSAQGIMPSANMDSAQSTSLNSTDQQTSTEPNAYDTEMWNQPHHAAVQTSISSTHSETSSSTQEHLNGNTPRVIAPFWAGMNGQVPGPASQHSTTSTSTNTVTESGNNETPVRGVSSQEWRTTIGSGWAEYERLEQQRRSIALAQGAAQVMGTPALYANNRPPYPHMAGSLQPLGPHFVPQQAYSLVPPVSFSYSPPEAQHAQSRRLPPLAQPRSNPHMSVPRPDVSNSIPQQREHDSQSSDGHTIAGAGTNPPQNPNTRRRPRRTDDPGLHHARRPSPPQYEGPGAQPINAQFAEMPVPPSGNYVSYSTLTPHQHALLARQIQMGYQLGHALRNMRPEEAEALRAYEEGIARGRRFHQAQAAAEEPPSKGLDNQNDGRPEPKEAEEMTVSLECKVCLSQIVDTVLVPCGHAVLCRWCANQHMPSSRGDHTRPRKPATCPMCRKPVKQKFRIYLS